MTVRSWQISEDLNDYVKAHITPPDAVLQELAAETSARYPGKLIMQTAPEMGTLLMLLARIARARTGTEIRTGIEIGTFTGYSAICLARGLGPQGRLISCDISEEWTAVARKYWEKAGLADRIELRLGPALGTLRALPPSPAFDLAFIDADKLNYPAYWEELVPRVHPGGLIMVDNTFWYGRVLDAGSQDPEVAAVRTVNDLAAADERVQLIMVPLGDGLTVAVKR